MKHEDKRQETGDWDMDISPRQSVRGVMGRRKEKRREGKEKRDKPKQIRNDQIIIDSGQKPRQKAQKHNTTPQAKAFSPASDQSRAVGQLKMSRRDWRGNSDVRGIGWCAGIRNLRGSSDFLPRGSA